jgi:hypothetical protein
VNGHFRISIREDGFRRYATIGAVSISKSERPMLAAAKSLLKHGVKPDATLAATFENMTIVPVALNKIVKHRAPPRCDHRQPMEQQS